MSQKKKKGAKASKKKDEKKKSAGKKKGAPVKKDKSKKKATAKAPEKKKKKAAPTAGKPKKKSSKKAHREHETILLAISDIKLLKGFNPRSAANAKRTLTISNNQYPKTVSLTHSQFGHRKVKQKLNTTLSVVNVD